MKFANTHKGIPSISPRLFDGGEEGAGGAGGQPPIDPKLLEEAVAKATAGLKKKNEELIGEKRGMQEKLSEFEKRFAGFGDVDPDHIKALIDRMNNDEETKLIAQGKIDEVIQRRTSALQGDYQSRLDASSKRLEELEQTLAEREEKIKDLVISGRVQQAAAELGVVPSAIDDIKHRAAAVFKLDDEGNPVARDKDGVIRMGKNGKDPLSVGEWLDAMKEKAPHWYAGNAGGGAGGGQGKGGRTSGHTITREQSRDHSVYKAAKETAAKAGVELQIVD